MISALSPLQLHPVRSLYQQKEKELKDIIGNLRLLEVKEDTAFEKTSAQIKVRTLLQQVKFGQPVIFDHREEESESRGAFDNPWSHRRRVIIVTVTYPFTGSEELFFHSPENMSFSLSGSGVWQPNGSKVEIELEVPSLDKNMVLTRAASMMTTTFSIINQINPQAQQWSVAMDAQIDQLLRAKRKELIDFYN